MPWNWIPSLPLENYPGLDNWTPKEVGGGVREKKKKKKLILIHLILVLGLGSGTGMRFWARARLWARTWMPVWGLFSLRWWRARSRLGTPPIAILHRRSRSASGFLADRLLLGAPTIWLYFRSALRPGLALVWAGARFATSWSTARFVCTGPRMRFTVAWARLARWRFGARLVSWLGTRPAAWPGTGAASARARPTKDNREAESKRYKQPYSHSNRSSLFFCTLSEILCCSENDCYGDSYYENDADYETWGERSIILC